MNARVGWWVLGGWLVVWMGETRLGALRHLAFAAVDRAVSKASSSTASTLKARAGAFQLGPCA